MTTAPDPQVVLVTGASSGIGRAAALRAAARGDHVVLVARGRTALEDTARECREVGAATAEVMSADVGDDAAVARVVDAVLSGHKTIDLVVHAAGVVAYGRTEDVPADVFDAVLRTNLVGSVNVARHVVPVLRRQEHGGLVLLGSLIGHIAVPTMSPYVLSKWGVHALARQLRVENRDLPDVHIAYVAPGGVDTPIYAQAASCLGITGRPPPPVDSPERVARIAIRRGERGQRRRQVGLANDLVRFGYNALPGLYDVLIGPLFSAGALDHTRQVPDGPGNVLESREAGNALHGNQGKALVGILGNLRQRWRAVADQPA
ncbi:SDR family NAD(P)-dependent oxidoreductase [Nocardioides sp. InS609-2]|uniref:SDR family NAD(P)-dependent oxidoreductase n=1 Tax=Nocardioides sp. InS609-2 TaxID=2760705 RepID=UPI0017A7E82C|nr:SDR family NAD(P)-dependent oxidoreductase [Nocardioides sp. InS609-2]MBA3780376.1 SDR family NAD(P)-dependent oxidoreductase [Nocardioides sp.]